MKDVVSNEKVCVEEGLKETAKKRQNEQINRPLRDLMEIIRFTENVSAKIHGILGEDEIYKIVKEEFVKSKQYNVSVFLLSDDGTKLMFMETSLSLEKLKVGEKVLGIRSYKGYKFDVSKSSFFSRVVRSGETIEANFIDVVCEFFPRPLAYLITKAIGYEKRSGILTPLKLHGKVIGILVVDSTELANYFIPSVKNLAQHISAALELANEYAEYYKAQEMLHRSEGKYRELTESISDVFFAMDEDLRYIYWNKASENLTGILAKDAIGKSLTEVFPDVRGTRIEQFYLETLRTQKPQSFVNAYKIKGKGFIFEINAYPSKDGLSVFVKDITEYKQMEELLRKSEERFRSIFENANDAMIFLDDSGRILEVNRKAVEVFSGSKEELLNKHFTKLGVISLRDMPRLVSAFAKCLSGKTANLNISVKNKKGQEIPLECSGSVIKRANKLAVLVIARDITERKKAEDAVRKSQEKVRAQYKGIPVPTYTWQKVGKDFVLVDYNDAAVAITHGKIANYVGEKASEMYRDRPEIPEDLLRCYTEKTNIGREMLYHYISTGEKRWLEVTCAFVPSDLVLVHTVDITERRKMEEILTALNFYGYKLDAANNLNEIYELVLDAMKQTLGFEYAELNIVDNNRFHVACQRGYNKSVCDLPLDGTKRGIVVRAANTRKSVLVPDVSKDEDYVVGVPGIKSELAVPIIVEGKVFGVLNVESRNLSAFDERDRMLLEILASHAAIAISNIQKTQSLGEYSENLEELVQKRTEELLESEKRYSVLVEEASDGVVMIQDGKTIFANKKALEITGYSRDELINLQPEELIDEKYFKFIKEGYDQTIRGQRVPIPSEAELITKTGEHVLVEGSPSLIDYQGRPAIIIIWRDIRERKRLEEQRLKLEKLATIGELATMVAHDLRNPLTSIRNASYYIKNTCPGNVNTECKAALEMLDVIEQEILFANNIINDLLDFAAKRPLQKKKQNINKIIEHSLTKSKIPENVNLEKNFTKEATAAVDEKQLERTFLNLIKNAVQAMPNGGKLTIKTSETKDHAEIEFTDTGVGISKENMNKLFTPLFTTKAKGIGIGLAICKKIVEQHNGTIDVESMVGKGTTFTIRLPKTEEADTK